MQTLAHQAHHEAGHFVALLVLGASDRMPRLVLRGGARSSIVRVAGETGPSALMATLVAIHAGYVAEARFDPVRAPLLRLSDEDALVARVLAAEIQDDAEDRARARAGAIVIQHWASITALAAHLLARGSLDRRDAALIVHPRAAWIGGAEQRTRESIPQVEL